MRNLNRTTIKEKIMKYTTTSCPHCGYKTRNRIPGTPDIELGQTIILCPNCKKLIVDTLSTEFEFMTSSERSKWTTEILINNYITVGLLFSLMGLLFVIGGFSLTDGYKIASIILGLLFLCYGISEFIKIYKAKKLNIGEQIIYESLLRTSNPDYVKALKKIYNDKRIYSALTNRGIILYNYKKYSTEDIHKVFQAKFKEMIILINKPNNDMRKTQVAIYDHY